MCESRGDDREAGQQVQLAADADETDPRIQLMALDFFYNAQRDLVLQEKYIRRALDAEASIAEGA